MILGSVNQDFDPLIRFYILDSGGQEHEVEGVVDTGFNDRLLTLPSTKESWNFALV